MLSKNDYNSSGCISYGLFVALKIKYCLTIDEYGIAQEHGTFKGFDDSKRLLGPCPIFNKGELKKISAM